MTESVIQSGPDWPRIRFSMCVCIYGGSIGFLTVLVNALTRISTFEREVVYMSLRDSLIFGGFGAFASIVILAPITWWLFGGVPKYASTKKRFPRGFWIWFLLAIGYSFVLPFVIGGYFYEMAARMIAFFGGIMTVPEMMEGTIDQVILSAFKAFILGFDFFFTTVKFSAPLFLIGAWLIDRFNGSDHPGTAKFAPWIIAVVLSALALSTMLIVPADVMQRFG